MIKLVEFVTIMKKAAKILGASLNAIRNWHRDGKMTAYRSPISGYWHFRKTNLADLSWQIVESGQGSTGWKRPTQQTEKPR